MRYALGLNNKALSFNSKTLGIDESLPILPPNTVRVRTSNGKAPIGRGYETATLVPGTSDVYDVYKSGTSFRGLLYNGSNVTEVLGANTNGITDISEMFMFCTSLTSVSLSNTSSVTNMGYMFYNCHSLTSIPLLDTSKVTNMNSMCKFCDSLTAVPLFDTSSVTDMSYMFLQCYNVESGALALYQQASTQANPPSTHNGCFTDCGSNTVTGAAELAQIPEDWK